MGSFFVACSRSAKESLGGANVCARPVLEMVRSVAIVTLRQTSLRTSASYAANPHSRQEIFLKLLKDLAEEKPSAQIRYALNRPDESSGNRSSTNDKNRCRSRCCRSDRSPADDSSLRLLSRRTLLHRMRAPSRFRLRRSRTAECILVRIELILFGSSLFALRIF